MLYSEVGKKIDLLSPKSSPIGSDVVSHTVLGDKSKSTALSSTEAKWTDFSIMPGSITKA